MKYYVKTIKLSTWILFTICMFLVLGYSSVQADTTNDERGNHAFLLNNPQDVNKFLEELEIDNNNFKVTVIKEIGLVYIEDKKNNKNLEQEITPYSKKLDSYINAEGELPKFKISSDTPNITDIKDIQGEKIQEEIQNPPLTSSYFKPFNWYLDDVTNNYQSQLINKGKNTSIALIDSGIDEKHPLLAHSIYLNLGKNYTSSESSIHDEMGHGTSVAGILTSIAPDMTIVPYKVLGAIDGESIWIIKAIIDAVNDGNDIINMSLGTYKSKSNKEDQVLIKAYNEAVKYATKHGVIVVSAAGNLSKNLDESNKNGEMHLPGDLKNVITVSSNTKINTRASYSNYGKNIDFSAPGGDLDEKFDVTGLVLTTYPTDKPNNAIDQAVGIPAGYTLNYGTSLSAPQVSATTALIISEYKKNKGKSPNINQVVKYLKKGALDLGDPGRDSYFGYGKINAYQSLLSMKR